MSDLPKLPPLRLNGSRKQRETCRSCQYYWANEQDPNSTQGFCTSQPPTAAIAETPQGKTSISFRPPVFANDPACRLHKP